MLIFSPPPAPAASTTPVASMGHQASSGAPTVDVHRIQSGYPLPLLSPEDLAIDKTLAQFPELAIPYNAWMAGQRPEEAARAVLAWAKDTSATLGSSDMSVAAILDGYRASTREVASVANGKLQKLTSFSRYLDQVDRHLPQPRGTLSKPQGLSMLVFSPPSPPSRAVLFGENTADFANDPEVAAAAAEMIAEYPELAMPYQMWLDGATPSELANALIAWAEGKVASDAAAASGAASQDVSPSTIVTILGAICGVAVAIVKTKWPVLEKLCGFIGAGCTIVAGLLTVGIAGTTQPPKPPAGSTCTKAPEACPGGQEWSTEFCRCISQKAFEPCFSGFGYFDLDEQCVYCGAGNHYDAGSRKCVEGCPAGWKSHDKWGCIPPGYNQPCDYQGGKGIVTPDGTCTLDGCDEGFRYDFETETCIAVGGGGGDDDGKTDDPPAASGTPWGAILLGTAVVLGGGYALWRSSAGASASAGDADERLQNPAAQYMVTIHGFEKAPVGTSFEQRVNASYTPLSRHVHDVLRKIGLKESGSGSGDGHGWDIDVAITDHGKTKDILARLRRLFAKEIAAKKLKVFAWESKP